MKVITGLAFAAALSLPAGAHAAGSMEDLDRNLASAQEYGITQFTELDFEDNGAVEVEGWLDDQWHAEVRIENSGEVGHEEREKRVDGPWGMTAEQVRQLAEKATQKGVTKLEEIQMTPNGYVEVEGDDDRGEELDLRFRAAE
ncbi:hypothetical protein [Thiohalorhabdus methylotrophus]|uniref:YpeB-like protein with protease inhibitory function n=1 Tax=Thiohalorhabdus methylotrophus TaxID=3242694 RepID=A0ABV4TSX1_9GAMM